MKTLSQKSNSANSTLRPALVCLLRLWLRLLRFCDQLFHLPCYLLWHWLLSINHQTLVNNSIFWHFLATFFIASTKSILGSVLFVTSFLSLLVLAILSEVTVTNRRNFDDKYKRKEEHSKTTAQIEHKSKQKMNLCVYISKEKLCKKVAKKCHQYPIKEPVFLHENFEIPTKTPQNVKFC